MLIKISSFTRWKVVAARGKSLPRLGKSSPVLNSFFGEFLRFHSSCNMWINDGIRDSLPLISLSFFLYFKYQRDITWQCFRLAVGQLSLKFSNAYVEV